MCEHVQVVGQIWAVLFLQKPPVPVCARIHLTARPSMISTDYLSSSSLQVTPVNEGLHVRKVIGMHLIALCQQKYAHQHEASPFRPLSR